MVPGEADSTFHANSRRTVPHRLGWAPNAPSGDMEELQFKLHFADHANAISVLMRVLLELSVENYIAQVSLKTR
jgi:hypothetical protein